MVYTATITTPANTTLDTPLITAVKAHRGVLYHFEVYFPPGPSGLVGVQIRVGNVQLYPVQREEYFIGDNTTIAFGDLYELKNETGIVAIHTYNVDTDYEHLVQVRMGIMSHDEFFIRYGRSSGESELSDMLAAIADQTADVARMSVEEAFEVI